MASVSLGPIVPLSLSVRGEEGLGRRLIQLLSSLDTDCLDLIRTTWPMQTLGRNGVTLHVAVQL